MIPSDQFKLVHAESQMGSHIFGWTGVRIEVAGKNLPPFPLDHEDPVSDILLKAAWEAGRQITKALEEVQALRNHEFLQSIQNERNNLLSLFPESIYVEEITNGYDGVRDWYGRLRPWFKVTTPKGHFIIGWRKRVIHLEWTDTTIEPTAEDLFPGEETTKFEKTIHCWGTDKAREYLQKLLSL